MGVAVLHHRVSFHPSSFSTPPPKPSRAANRAERSSPPSASRSAPKPTTTAISPSPVKPPIQARPGRRSRVPAEDPPATRRSGGGVGLVAKLPGKSLVMGEVTILKRGEGPRVTASANPAPLPVAVPRVPTPASAPKQPLPPPPPPVADRPSGEAAAAAAASKADDVVFSSTERLGPEPEILPKQIRLTHHPKSQLQKAAVYAGSGFIASPSPSCLPFPSSFFAKKDLADKAEAATNTIKYLLRLDLA